MLEASPVDLPVARVAVDVSLSHLDRPFDYAVTPEQDADAVPGARVRLRFAGKQRDGMILDRVAETEHGGRLAPLNKVISAEPVLTSEIARLVRQVADHYAGSFADVMRLAVPPRHAATEKAASGRVERRVELPPEVAGAHPTWSAYPTGPGLLSALGRGQSPRAAWQVIPTAAPPGDWAAGFAAAALATLRSGRGSVLIVPDQRDLDRLQFACARVLGEQAFVALSADLGPSARYRAFLAVLRGRVKVVLGTRAASFAPVHDLGLVALWDDGDDSLSEPRAPYPHARDVLALRVADARAAALFAGYGRTAEVQQWVERGWLTELSAERTAVRHTAPRVKVSADTDAALERDPAARAARVPHDVFTVLRSALPQGPVLVQVPRGGYLVALVCQSCREPARCTHCGGPTRIERSAGHGTPQMACSWCARLQVDWTCPICGAHRVRAPIVGAARTAEEFGKSFPHTPIRRSMAGQLLTEVPPTSSIVVATPGAEPAVADGYAAAVLLDTHLLLLRPDLRAGEEALRRWLNAVALVRGGADGGSVIAVGDSSGRALQALVRLDPQGAAVRELAERAEARFAPAVKLLTVEGRSSALAEFTELAVLPEPTEVLGPVEIQTPPGSEETLHRLTLRTPLANGAALVRAVKDVTSIRSAKKSEGALRVRVDPAVVG